MRAAVRGRISENTPWKPPSIEAAREFEVSMHPRRPEGGKFNAVESTMGRYCFLGGCGEQLDLWDEVKRGGWGGGGAEGRVFVAWCCFFYIFVGFGGEKAVLGFRVSRLGCGDGRG